MRFAVRFLSIFIATLSCATAEEIRGSVFDPAGAAVPGASVSAVGRVGVLAQTSTDLAGAFVLNVPERSAVRVIVTAAGF